MHPLLKAVKILESLEATTKRTVKLELLQDGEDNKYLKKIFQIAYTPCISYGIELGSSEIKGLKEKNKKLPPKKAFSQFIKLTNKLSKRELTGNKAVETTLDFLASVPPKFRKWAVNSINRNLRVGVNEATFSQVWEDMRIDFGVPLANSYQEKKKGQTETKMTFPVMGEPKYDGTNLSLINPGDDFPITFLVKDQKYYCLSRGMVHYPIVEYLWKKIKKHIKKDEFVVCEAYAKWTKKERLTFKSPWSKASSLLKTGMSPKGGYQPDKISPEYKKMFKRDFQLLIFEYGSNRFYSAEHDYTDPMPRKKRRKRLVKLVKKINHPQIKVTPCVKLNNQKEADAYYADCLSKGYEGCMYKDPNAPLINTRDSSMLKRKPEIPLDGITIGVYRGSGKNAKWAGGISVYLTKQKVVTNCNAGTDKDRNDFWNRRKELIGTQAEFKAQKEPKGASVSDSRFIVFKRLREDLKKWTPTKISRLVGKRA